MECFFPNETAKTPAAPAGSETAGFAGLANVKIIAKDENSVVVEFSVPDTNPYFDGHFPDFPILPAVAQTELVIRFASRYLGTGIDISEIRRIKFTNIIRPSAPIVLKLEKKEKIISFGMFSPNGESVYSTGAFEIREGSFPKQSGAPEERGSPKGSL